MRDLTSAEYRTVLSILAHPGTTERERIRESRLPSSTYNVVRRRAFEQGWLEDVVVPNPGPCGFAGVEFLLARPIGSHRADLVRAWGQNPDCVLLWSGVHAVFGAFFCPFPKEAVSSEGATSEDSGPFSVRVERGHGSVPVYFDYAGLWARFGGRAPPSEYPTGLDPTSAVASPRTLGDAQRLMRSGRSGAPPRSRWTSLVSLARAHPHALDGGAVQSRTMLGQAKLPAYEGRRIGEVIFVRGRLRPGRSAAGLLNALTGECGVYPFLLAESDGRVLLAGLGQTSARDPGRVLVASALRPVLPSITRHMEPADVLIEPVEAIEERVHHRYPDRFPASAPMPSGP